MNFTIVAKPFFQSAGCLTAEQRLRLETFVANFQQNPQNPKLGFEQVDNGMWLCRIARDVFAVLHHQDNRYSLLFVGSREDAAKWCREHRVELHPVTGTIQIVRNHTGNGHPITAASDPLYQCFGQFKDDFLMQLGVPADWTDQVRQIRDERSFWDIYEQMPEDAAERLYALSLGEQVSVAPPVNTKKPLKENLDNLRWMYVIEGNQTISEVLARPFQEWILFLHPSQRSLVTREFNGPSKVTGSAGTGKTVVALHRARHLARFGKKVLLTTYTKRLVNNLQRRISQLCYCEEQQRIRVATVHSIVQELARQIDKKLTLKFSFESEIEEQVGRNFTSLFFLPGKEKQKLKFVEDEWNEVIDRHGVRTWEEYRDVSRTGRGTGLTERQREKLWKVFEPIITELNRSNDYPPGMLCRKVREALTTGKIESPFNGVIVDEVQDLNPEELRLLAALCDSEPDNLTIIGDAGQRIYPGGFSLKQLGINIVGRSHILKINYRTTYETARAASALRSHERLDDEDETEAESDTSQCLLRGAKPVLIGFPSDDCGFGAHTSFLVSKIRDLLNEGVAPSEIGVFTRTRSALVGMGKELRRAGIPIFVAANRRDENDSLDDSVYLSTLHGAKGLEFRYVIITNCSSSKLPLKTALKAATDNEEKEAIRCRERNLLYVAMTRARDQVWLTWVGNRSPFLDDIEKYAQICTP